MSDNKKYYWLKLKEDFFDDDTISWIEEQENGKEYCLFYLKLCLKSLKTNGILVRNVGQMLIPYDAKKLGEITNTPADTVMVAMKVFENVGLVQILEEFMEKYPGARINNRGIPPELCPDDLGYSKAEKCGTGNNICVKCWNRPLADETEA